MSELETTAMYVTVRFGECQSEIFNPNCRIISLLKNIRDRCKGSAFDGSAFEAGEVELSDENGNIKFLRDSPYRFANEILSEREKFVLLKVDKYDNCTSYTPLLVDSDSITDDFLSRLAVKDESDGSAEARAGKGGGRKGTSNDKTAIKGQEKDKNSKLRLAKSITSVVRSRSRSSKTSAS